MTSHLWHKPYHNDSQYHALNERLHHAGNVFLYQCWHTPDDVTITHHRHMISTTLEDFKEQEKQRTASHLQHLKDRLVNAKNTKEKRDTNHQLDRLQAYLSFATNADKASYVKLDTTLISHVDDHKKPQPSQGWFYDLYCSFLEPPYGLHGTEQEKIRLWQELTSFVGLMAADRAYLTVFDWAIHNQGCWSGFFDDGLDWWGIWCLTIYNKRQNSLGCLIASSTD